MAMLKAILRAMLRAKGALTGPANYAVMGVRPGGLRTPIARVIPPRFRRPTVIAWRKRPDQIGEMRRQSQTEFRDVRRSVAPLPETAAPPREQCKELHRASAPVKGPDEFLRI